MERPCSILQALLRLKAAIVVGNKAPSNSTNSDAVVSKDARTQSLFCPWGMVIEHVGMMRMLAERHCNSLPPTLTPSHPHTLTPSHMHTHTLPLPPIKCKASHSLPTGHLLLGTKHTLGEDHLDQVLIWKFWVAY